MVKIPSDWHICATCSKWGGNRHPGDVFMINVEYDEFSTGKCYGGYYNMLETAPLSSCHEWAQQYKK